MIMPFKTSVPKLGNEVFIAPGAWVIGNVEIADSVSIFFGSVLRGDIQPIRIGRGTNIQEHSMLHTTQKRSPAIVGEYVTIGHRAIVHGCKIGDRSLVGMGAIVLDDTVIEEECLIAAGTIVPEGKTIPAKSMVMGVPGKVVRTLSEEEIRMIRKGTDHYIELGKEYQEFFLKAV